MRCFFMKDGLIATVEFLTQIGDEGWIAEAGALYRLKGEPQGADGFEVWDGPRLVHRF
jgi:hypothetical protein